MHIFGEHWRDADPNADVLILAGDLSWAMKPDEVLPDLRWIAALRGRKIIIRGNHDFWWHSLAKVRAAAGPTVEPLQANCFILNRIAFVGTRGWQCPGSEPSSDALERFEAAQTGRAKPVREYTAQDYKIYQREVGRLRLGLEQAQRRRAEYDRLVVVLHYPPVNSQHEPSEFTQLLEAYRADWCVYGHLHGDAIASGFNGVIGPTRYRLVSADSVQFSPFQLSHCGRRAKFFHRSRGFGAIRQHAQDRAAAESKSKAESKAAG